MMSLSSWVIIGMLGMALLMGDSAPTRGHEKPRISFEQASVARPLKLEAVALPPITGLAAAAEQVTWSKQHIPPKGQERSFRLSQLARLYFFLGEEGDQKAQKSNYRRGSDYARLLIKEQPQSVEGHYWLALNLCGLASVTGAKNGLFLLPNIIDLLETSLILDEAYDQAGAHRVLGRIYFRAPVWPLSVGDRQKSFQHLSQAVKIAPQDSTNHLFLAETLYCLGKTKEADEELEKVLNGTSHALWPQGLEDDRYKAQELRKAYNPKKDVASLPDSSCTDLPDQIK